MFLVDPKKCAKALLLLLLKLRSVIIDPSSMVVIDINTIRNNLITRYDSNKLKMSLLINDYVELIFAFNNLVIKYNINISRPQKMKCSIPMLMI